MTVKTWTQKGSREKTFFSKENMFDFTPDFPNVADVACVHQ